MMCNPSGKDNDVGGGRGSKADAPVMVADGMQLATRGAVEWLQAASRKMMTEQKCLRLPR